MEPAIAGSRGLVGNRGELGVPCPGLMPGPQALGMGSARVGDRGELVVPCPSLKPWPEALGLGRGGASDPGSRGRVGDCGEQGWIWQLWRTGGPLPRPKALASDIRPVQGQSQRLWGAGEEPGIMGSRG